MPLYEYECASCGARFELLVRETGATEGRCPSCGSPRLVKRFSVFSVASGGDKRCPGMPETPCPDEAPCHHSCPWEH